MRFLYLVLIVSSLPAFAHSKDKNHCFVWPDVIKGQYYCNGVRVEGGAPCAEGAYKIGKSKKLECVPDANVHSHSAEETQNPITTR